ncbi:MAG: 50S ribosomal protein L30 [Leptospiraceae bacterium]|nr:50S ribosomal protein L30 [Leptospiraceae bacterium]MCP5496657.1 50S ribosomal protein L30 [Leptospiraceae bacterium]
MVEIKVTQIKSQIGAIPRHRKTLQALGLKKIGSERIHKDSPQLKGMLRAVRHLIKFEQINNK